MNAGTPRTSPIVILLIIAACAMTLGASLWLVQMLGQANRYTTGSSIRAGMAQNATKASDPNSIPSAPALPGVRARLSRMASPETRGSIGSNVIERRLPTMAFALQPGESLDARLAPGPFRAEFDVPFYTGEVRDAQLGVAFQGGKVIISRKGQIILSDAAGEKPRIAMTTLPQRMLVDQDMITIAFESDGKQPCRLRAIWQPEEAMVPLPLPVVTSPLLSDEASKGFALVQQFNCASCHASGSSDLQALLAANTGPILGDAGSRLHPNWMRAWLTEPAAIKPDAHMPTVNLNAEAIEDITHYLASLGGPNIDVTATPDPDLVNTGMVAYHTVGCFTCHGPLERIDVLPGGHPASSLQSMRAYELMGRPSQKFTARVLAEFLRDPTSHWPSGRMPSLSLEPIEADAIAAYLIARDSAEPAILGEAGLSLDSGRVERGLSHFASSGCANCHALGPDRPTVASSLTAPSLESLAAARVDESSGCMAPQADPKSPHFNLNDSQRRAIRAFLASLSERRTTNVPLDHLALTYSRLNCNACHVFNGDRGPEAFVAQYFSAIEEADLGDEGRVPPNLSDVGGRLNPQWMHEVLAAGGRARPYLGARMPQFGEKNIDALPSQFASAAGVWAVPDQGPAVPSEYGEIGRQLVGAKAMNCIQCHDVAGRPSTGTPGPDLAQMAERLRYEAFSRWVLDPKLTRPGTRMPSFFVNGASAFTDMLNGDANKQVEAIWAYLSLGEFMPLPDGMVDPSSLTLQVKNEPVIFRSFIKGAGVRAIAVGYPEQVHIAFDADKCQLSEVWEGDFINAAGAWANRGGTETNPKSIKWSAPRDSLFVSASVAGGTSSEVVTRFRGYRLDAQRRPIFMYELRAGDIEIMVSEQPLPARVDGRARMTQRFTLEGPRGAKVILAPNKRTATGLNGDASDGAASITLDESGKAAFDLEVTW